MFDRKKTLLILNPFAGKGKGLKNLDLIESKLKKKFTNLEVKVSDYPGHILNISKTALEENYSRIISVGGDGTPFEIINGLYVQGKPQKKIELGMIPAGTGNSFIRDFIDISLKKSLNSILAGNNYQVDLVEFSYFKKKEKIKKYYLNILGIGLIADILKLTNEKLKFLGTMGYNLAVLSRISKGMKNQIHLKVDGKIYQIKNSALVISNSKYTGGKMKIAPMANTSDGKEDLVIFNEVNRKEIVDIFIKVFKGDHINHQKVIILKGSEIEINAEPQQLLMADGELLGTTPLKIKVLPRELRILI